MIIGELVVLIAGSNAALMGSLAQSETAMKGFSATASEHHSIVAGAAHAAGLAVLGMGAAAVVGGAIAAKSAGDFQEQMAIINTIAHQTPAELDKTGVAIRQMAASTGEPLGEMTHAFYDLLSAGVPVGQAMSVLKDSTTLAIGGLASTSQTVDLLTTAINSYHLNAGGATKATDQFALAVQDGKVTAAQIAATFADVAPLAKQMGVGIDEISATYAVLTSRGVPAAESTTQMNRAMVELLKPNADLNALQAKTHENFAKIAGEKGLVVALQDMREAAEKNGVPFQDLFGRLEGFKFALATTGPNFATYGDELAKMHHANGTAAAQAEERMGTFHRQMAILGETFNNLLITVGLPLLPFFTSLVENIRGGVDAVSDWLSSFPSLTSALASIPPHLAAMAGAFLEHIPAMAQALVGRFAEMGQALVAWISPMIPVVLSALGDLGASVGAWITAQAPVWGSQIGEWASAFVDWVSPMIPPALDALGELASEIVAWITAQIPGWVSQMQAWTEAFLAWAAPLAGRAIGELGNFAAALAGWVAQQLPSVAAAAAPIAGAIAQAIVGGLDALAGGIGDAIGNAIANFDPSKLADNLGAILSSAAIIGAVVIAGQLVGAAYAAAYGAAAAAVKAASGLITAAIAAEQGAISTAAGAVGGAIGSVFALAYRTAATAVGVLTAPFIAAMAPVGTAIAAGMAPIGAGIGAALDAAIGVGMAIGVPVLIAAGIALIGAAIAVVITKLFPGFAESVSHNFAAGVAAMQRFVGEVMTNLSGIPGSVSQIVQQVAQFFLDLPGRLAGVGAEIVRQIMEAVGQLPHMVGDALNQIPGVSLVGQVGANVVGAGQTAANAVTGSHADGVWNVGSDHIAQIHAGEMVVPAGPASAIRAGGGGGGSTTVHRHIHIELGGRELKEWIETEIMNNASAFSSGFAGAE